MGPYRQPVVVLAVVSLAALAADSPARADLVLVTSRSALGATDRLDWGVLGPPSPTPIPSPFMLTSPGGVGVTVSKPAGSFFRVDEDSTHGGWVGNFGLLDRLLWTFTDGGPMTLRFSTPVSAGGAQIQPDSFGDFTAKIEAFDPSGTSLGSFTLPGVSTSAEDNTAIFLGVESDSANIARLVFSLTAAPPLNPSLNDFAINQFDFRVGPAVAAVPEPGGVALLGLGLVGLIGRAWRRANAR
jgi:hypothetical protein